nr:uncharacterized protein LOC127335724 [Lolium perenne]
MCCSSVSQPSQISISIFNCLATEGHDAPEVFLSPDLGGCLAVLTALEFRLLPREDACPSPILRLKKGFRGSRSAQCRALVKPETLGSFGYCSKSLFSLFTSQSKTNRDNSVALGCAVSMCECDCSHFASRAAQ